MSDEHAPGAAVFFLGCPGCGEDDSFTPAIIAGHALHLYCNNCEEVIDCVTPARLRELIASECNQCGAGADTPRGHEH